MKLTHVLEVCVFFKLLHSRLVLGGAPNRDSVVSAHAR